MHLLFVLPETSGGLVVGCRLPPESVGCGLVGPRVLAAGCPLGSVGFVRTSLWARCPSAVVGFAWLPYGQPAFFVVAVHQCPLTASCPARRCEVRLAGLEAGCLVANRFPATVTGVGGGDRLHPPPQPHRVPRGLHGGRLEGERG